MHVHKLQHEAITVREGRLGWMGPDGVEHFVGAGETVTWAPGQVHRFWNAGDEPLRGTGELWPPHNVEYFTPALVSDPFKFSIPTNPGHCPDQFATVRIGPR